MRFERGPFGRIAVIAVESESDVILHALDVLQNHVIPGILSAYLREQMGVIQLCIDCTGYSLLSDVYSFKWESLCQKRKCVADFLRTLICAQDHFIDSELFVMNPEYVFFDPEYKQLYWCCVPILSNKTKKDPDSRNLSWGKLELLLMNPFFYDIMEEDQRNQVLCLLRDEREDDLIKLLEVYASDEFGSSKSEVHHNKFIIRLTIQLILMMVFFAACLFLAMKKYSIFFENTWSSWYVLIFTFLLIMNAVLGRDKVKMPVLTQDISNSETAVSLSRKEMYFPSHREMEKRFSTDSPSSQFSPAFLTQQITPSGKDSKPLRAVIWVNDFLIGRDKSLCDLFLDHPSVSDRHARILHREPVYYLVDLGSAAGTWIGSRRLYSFEENPLSDGDIFICGDFRFVFNHAI
ncbi:MAG: FHA domain-containing protein [Eubacteriales bacterium]